MKSADKYLLASVVFLLVFSLTVAPGLSAANPPSENVLGYSLGQLLLGWNMLTMGTGSPGKILEGTDLGNVLSKLESASKDLDLPDFVQTRFSPLQEKYELSKSKFLWKYHPGYWGCNNDKKIKLSGVEIASDVAESQTRKFRYIQFSSKTDTASIFLSDSYLSSQLKSFTLELWLRTNEEESGILLKTGNLSLEITENVPILTGGSGEVLVQGRKMIPGRWNHLAITSDGEIIKLFQNAEAIAEYDMTSPLLIGDELKFGGGYIGEIDEIRVRDKAVPRLMLNFDQPIDYYIVYPVAWAARQSFDSGRRWDFYASLLVSGLTLKRENKFSSLSPDKLEEVFSFLAGKVPGAPAPPEDLPEDIVDGLEAFSEVSNEEEITAENKKEIANTMGELVSYLKLD